MLVRGAVVDAVVGRDDPVGPLTLNLLPSANSMLSKKHM